MKRYICLLLFIFLFSCSNEAEKYKNIYDLSENREGKEDYDYQENTEGKEDYDYQEDNKKTWNWYDCINNCEWHQAWYDWAEKNEINDLDDCDTNSNSFNEWCTEYVEEKNSDYDYSDINL